MDNWIVGFITAAIVCLLVCFGWIAGASAVGWECKNLGVASVGNTIFECSIKDKK